MKAEMDCIYECIFILLFVFIKLPECSRNITFHFPLAKPTLITKKTPPTNQPKTH